MNNLVEKIREYFEYQDGGVYWKKQKGSRGVVGNRFGCSDGRYRHGMFEGKMFREHQLVWLLHHSELPACIDHIDNNPVNNQVTNLREATQRQNCTNVGKRKHNTTGHKNVVFDRERNKYRVELRLNNKTVYFGRYDDLELAGLVAEEARDKYHGTFARSI